MPVEAAPTTRCESVVKDTTRGTVRTLTRFIRCNRSMGHAEKHFAAWGGSQKWRQRDWNDDHPDAMTLAEVPNGKRVW